MKDLTIEEKAKAYDEALKNAKYYHDAMEGDVCCVLEECFPQLKDEIMRSMAIKAVYSPEAQSCIKSWGINPDDVIAWLEKKGEQKYTNTDNKFIRMRETKPKDISEFLDRLTTVEQEFLWEHIAKIRELDKEESNFIDKVEPKFKVGDWIVTNKKHIWYVDETPETTSYLYRLINQHGNVEVAEFEVVDKKARLWTIEDVKDGDVLATKKGNPFIYDKNRYNNGLAYYYAGLDVHKELTLKNPHNMLAHFGELRSVFPATKEQRDILFTKIKEAGYKWDAEKRELKRIELQSSQWNISDFRTWQYIVSDVLTKHDGIGQYLDDGFCKKIAKYMQEEWSKKLCLVQYTVEWNEEDEEMIEGLNNCLDELEKESGWCYVYVNNKNVKLNKVRNWLKFVKERVQIQPMKGE